MYLFEQVPREYGQGVGMIQAASRKVGMTLGMVPQALASAIPAERRPARRTKTDSGSTGRAR